MCATVKFFCGYIFISVHITDTADISPHCNADKLAFNISKLLAH